MRTTPVSTASVAPVARWPNASRPPVTHAAWNPDPIRQAASATMITRNVIAKAGTSRSKTLPNASHIRTSSRTTSTGIAKISASRLRRAYHCPRPGQRNESAAAIVEERPVERLGASRRTWLTVDTTPGSLPPARDAGVSRR